MVKGVTKRVVVVRCPDTKYFEEAIFLVREDAAQGMDPDQVLKEACKAADSYIRENTENRKKPWGWVAGAAATVLLVFGLVLLL